MSDLYKYQVWANQCQKMIEARKRNRRRAVAALMIYKFMQLHEKRDYKQKRFWIHPIFQLRQLHGFYEAIFPTLLSFPDKFQHYCRLSKTQFEELMCLIGPLITKQNTVRDSIPAAARLSMTLRYLATGDCMSSTSYQYLVGMSTISNIIKETCQALVTCLRDKAVPFPLTTTDWLKIAKDFENQWQFDHCIGAIDGKHVLIECPDGAGSAFYNYKYDHSIVLLAICDANYIFTMFDIGAYGRRSDGGIFRDSLMGRKFNTKKMNLPNPEPLTVDGIPLPYVLVGDAAFTLSDYLLRPYAVDKNGGLSLEHSIFNYRLSRARRTIENAYGIIVAQWRILKKPIENNVNNTIDIVQAIICLHNWIRRRDYDNEYIQPHMVDNYASDGFIPGSCRQEIQDSALRDINAHSNHNSSRIAVEIREEFCDYFNAEGAVSWQYNRN